MQTVYAILAAVVLGLLFIGYFLVGIGIVAISKTKYFRWLASERYWRRCDMRGINEADIDLLWPFTLIVLPSLVLLKGSQILIRRWGLDNSFIR
ncbi:MAG: hypothetical protein Q7S53_03540 [bacterium]|nr:hypothetical protein [bacterium]